MAINNPPITKDTTLNMTLLELIEQLNLLEQKHLRLLEDIRKASSLSDLQTRIDV
tara:strand:- start:56 stop:220 length:165 start_codon:yes stop_codon:yes gene_type:complete